jgi:hypothetical protein
MKKTEQRLDELLSPDRLSGAEHDEIFSAVADKVSPRLPIFGPRAAIAFGLCLASVCAVVWMSPRVTPSSGEFAVKGGSARMFADTVCVPEGCHAGSKLVIALGHVASAGFVGAFARAPSGRIVYYFAGDDSLPVSPTAEVRVLPQTVILGRDHAELGRWELHVVVSSAPLPRDALIAAAADPSRATTTTFVVSK